MAAPTNVFDTYESVGNREDLTDMIWDVSPSETPFLSAIPKVKAKAIDHQWQTDALSTAGANAQLEGNDAVTGTQEAIDKAGRNSEMAYQLAKAMKEIKLDMEWAMLDGGGTGGIGNAKVNTDLGTAREMGSIQTYVVTNADVGSGAGAVSSGTGADTMTAGTARDFAESQLTTVLQEAFVSGGDPKLLFLSAANKSLLSGFTGGGTHYVDKDNKKLVNTVEFYTGDFHTLKAMPSRQIAGEIVLAVDPQYVACAELRPVSAKPLAATGDAIKKQVVAECTLEVRNEKACAIIADVGGA
jgi:hypothetical protein